MSFEQFFETYPIADWILNVFKTLSPTLTRDINGIRLCNNLQSVLK